GGVAVPLAPSHPPPELDYVIRDSDAAVVVADTELAPRLDTAPAAVRRLSTATALAAAAPTGLPEVADTRRAMILYTSGTTGKPKGVVTTHANLEAQVRSLVAAWEWRADDRILLVLPLHHVHGIVDVLGCASWGGAGCGMTPPFDAGETWGCAGRPRCAGRGGRGWGAGRCRAARGGWWARAGRPSGRARRESARFAAAPCSASTGGAPRRRPPRSGAAGSAPETSRCSRTAP